MNISEKFEQLSEYLEAKKNTKKYKLFKFYVCLLLFISSCFTIKFCISLEQPYSGILSSIVIIIIFFSYIPIVNTTFRFIFKIDTINKQRQITDELNKRNPLLKIVYITMIVIVFFVPVKVLQVELFTYEDEQLKLYGKKTQVKIESIRSSGKSGTHAYFKFEHNGEIIEESLSPRNYKEGDYKYIEYSTKDPHIVRWWSNE